MSDDAADDFVDAEKLSELWWGLRPKSDAEQGAGMAKLTNAERLARAVLLFFDSGEWTREKREQWKAVTGNDECVSKVLGDMAREVRDEEERHEAEVAVLASRLGEINDDAGNKFVWKNHASQSEWIRGKLLPWIRDAARIISEEVRP